MPQALPRPMSKSPKQVAEQALSVAQRSLPSYSGKHSPRRFTQHQLFAIAALRQFFRVDYRGIEAILVDSSDLREVLGLNEVPHFSTLFYAERRLFKGGVRLANDDCGVGREDDEAAG
jgi:hypothetical protein